MNRDQSHVDWHTTGLTLFFTRLVENDGQTPLSTNQQIHKSLLSQRNQLVITEATEIDKQEIEFVRIYHLLFYELRIHQRQILHIWKRNGGVELTSIKTKITLKRSRYLREMKRERWRRKKNQLLKFELKFPCISSRNSLIICERNECVSFVVIHTVVIRVKAKNNVSGKVVSNGTTFRTLLNATNIAMVRYGRMCLVSLRCGRRCSPLPLCCCCR